MESNRSVSKKLDHLSIPNGMAWSLARDKFYHIDTPTSQVVAYDYNVESGNINNKKTVIKIPKQEGAPDGMTIDNEGMLWIAHWNGWQITRWNPISGKKLFQFSLPVANITSCSFGGDELQDIFITTARATLTEKELEKQPLAGSLFVIKNSGYTGMKPFKFGK